MISKYCPRIYVNPQGEHFVIGVPVPPKKSKIRDKVLENEVALWLPKPFIDEMIGERIEENLKLRLENKLDK